jgi:thiosulfate/3-mercaptopyruvate sulfurtransferase
MEKLNMQDKVLISPKELASMLENKSVVVIDTRSPEDYATSHIPGAINIHEIFTHFAFSSSEGIETLHTTFSDLFGAAGLSGEETAVIYENTMNKGYGQSCRGFFLLKYLGYPKVAVLHGGKKAWDIEGFPTTSEFPTPQTKSFPLKVDPSILVTTEEMLRSLNNPFVFKLDVRDYEEWSGITASPQDMIFCPRKGRIPNSVWIEWQRMMVQEDDGIPMFRSKEEILEICSQVGIKPESTVYIYCLAGIRASNTYIALKEAGIRDVRVYLGSWFEWSRDPELPIEQKESNASRMISQI